MAVSNDSFFVSFVVKKQTAPHLLMGGGFAEAVHDGEAEAVLGDGFGEDEIESGFVEAAEFGEEGGGGFAEVAGW